MREEGYVTIQTIDKKYLYEPNVPIQAFGVSTMHELMEDFNKYVLPQIKRGTIKTVVVELTYYTNDVIDSAPSDANGWVKYMALGNHIKSLEKIIKGFPGCRLVYNALAAPEKEVDKAPTGIMTAGKAISKVVPAATSLMGYLRTEDMGNGVVDRILHLTTYGPYLAGHRFGSKLPPFVRNPTYRALAQLLSGEMVADADGNVVPPGSVVLTGGTNANGKKASPPVAPLAQDLFDDPPAPLPPLDLG
jgi:hypothetical protein